MNHLELSTEELRDFMTYLRNLSQSASLKPYYFKKQRILQIYIPILENGGHIPESMDFAQLAESLLANAVGVRIELVRYLQDYQASKQRPLTSKTRHAKPLNTREMAEKMGISPDTLRQQARRNQIRGAIKKGRRWIFFQNN